MDQRVGVFAGKALNPTLSAVLCLGRPTPGRSVIMKGSVRLAKQSRVEVKAEVCTATALEKGGGKREGDAVFVCKEHAQGAPTCRLRDALACWCRLGFASAGRPAVLLLTIPGAPREELSGRRL